VFAEDDDRSGDSPGCRRRNAVDEGTDLRIPGEALVEWADDYYEKIYRQENTQGGSARAGGSKNDIPNESNRNHYRAGRNHGYGYGIKKLGFRQPMMFLDNASMKKWNNREAAAKDKQTRLQEKYE
jgi:hypothetical protein